MNCSLPQAGGVLCPEAEAPPGSRGTWPQCSKSLLQVRYSLGGPEMGEAKQLETQLMSPAVLIPTAEMLVQVPLGLGHCIIIFLLHLTQIDDYFLILLFLVSQ